ncbi:ATP-binding protein [Cohnella sp. CIP 111063]|uniref:ATP-binding protein n=1 Tax=unclassified Cohnella TaxID=2636738 RepID=UPI00351539C3
MLLLLTEMLLNIFTGVDTPEARLLLPAVVFIMYVLNPLPEALWVVYLYAIIQRNRPKKNIVLNLLVALPVALNAVFSVASLFGDGEFLFGIDGNNVYHRGPYFWLMLAMCYIYLIYNIVLMIVKRKQILRHEFWVSLCVALLPVLGGAVQSLFFGASLTWLCLSFALLIAYANLQSGQVYRELRALDKLKDEFLANTSHELHTPLNGIINITNSVLESDRGGLTLAQRQNLQVVASTARRMYSLINDISDTSSIKNGELRLNKRMVDLRSIADGTLYMISRLKGSKEIEFINSIPAEVPPLYADEERLYQIFYNLIGNALKFTQQGTIEVGAVVRQKQAEIWVEDTGCGISSDNLNDIFKPFYRENTENGDTRGTGLGLYITKSLIERHGGEIRAVSEEGRGSRFTFTLPLSAEPRKDIPLRKAVTIARESARAPLWETNRSKSARKYSILVADDDPASLTALFNILDHEGYYVKGVTNGAEVLLELDRHSEYNLVIMDMVMPKLSGYEALKKIRQRFMPLDMPVLLLTAKARPEYLEAGFEAGANDYLPKPFEALELKARVKTLVQLKDLVSTRMEAELSFLQAQIKPHFLYNSLSVIAALSTKEPQRAEELLYDLSDYLRGSFNFENYNGVVPLSNELDTVRAYISIEKERFRGKLQVKYEIDESVGIAVPILFIQPLVENAIRHGVSKKPEGGTVRLSIKRDGGHTVITVEDDGVGIPAQKLDGLLEEKGVKSGVGLSNIQRRMILNYGHGLNIQSAEGRGTIVTMVIPDQMR